ncbi:uncharacterized protein LOC116618883 [Nematostella vectensis]|uniref:uncharacterized protein LOC116618883 n=1 Tax=Nematostella vectensis TaxID=45351 RepID=UPI0013903369|nr:uncharacterized protein LOC116618883 [Nematostella vectensis]
MGVLKLVLVTALTAVICGQTTDAVRKTCPGGATYEITKAGCYNANPAVKKGLTTKLFTRKQNSYAKPAFEKFVEDAVCECAAATVKRKKPVFGLRNTGQECLTGTVYDAQKEAPISKCRQKDGYKCAKSDTCAVGLSDTAFVYTVKKATPTKKPTPAKKKPAPKKPAAKKPAKAKKPGAVSSASKLRCNAFVVKLKLKRTPPGKPGTHEYNAMKCSICSTIKTLYHCYPCFHSSHFIKTEKSKDGKSTLATLVLRFGCAGNHLKKLEKKLETGSIVSAVCQKTNICRHPGMSAIVPGCSPLTMCSTTPYCPAPFLPSCQAPAYPPALPSQVNACPYGCASSCAPTCSIGCCKKSNVRQNDDVVYDYKLD